VTGTGQRSSHEPPTPGFSVLGVIRPHRPSSQRFALSRVRGRRCAKLRSVARWRAAWVTVSVTAVARGAGARHARTLA